MILYMLILKISAQLEDFGAHLSTTYRDHY